MQFTGNGIVTTYNDRNPFVIPNSVQVVTSESGAISYVENTGVLLMADSGIQNYFNDYGYGLGGEAYLLDRTFAKIRNINLVEIYKYQPTYACTSKRSCYVGS